MLIVGFVEGAGVKLFQPILQKVESLMKDDHLTEEYVRDIQEKS